MKEPLGGMWVDEARSYGPSRPGCDLRASVVATYLNALLRSLLIPELQLLTCCGWDQGCEESSTTLSKRPVTSVHDDAIRASQALKLRKQGNTHRILCTHVCIYNAFESSFVDVQFRALRSYENKMLPRRSSIWDASKQGLYDLPIALVMMTKPSQSTMSA